MLLERILFLMVLSGLLLLKETLLLFGILIMLCILFYRDFIRLNKRVFRSILFFNIGVTIGYLLMSEIKGFDPLPYLLYINVKVYVITFFVFGFFSRVNVIAFFAFSKELSYLLTISLSQIISYTKSFEEFRLAYKARVVKRWQMREKAFILKVFDQFLQKSFRESKERTLAMKARGFFD